MNELKLRGDALFEQHRWEMALELYQQHLLQLPEDAEALCMVARCYLHLELFGKASEYAEMAVSVSPDLAYAYYIQSYIFHLRNLDQDARRALEAGLELEPSNPDFHVLMGRLHAKLADWLQAQDSADTALGFEPKHADALVLKSVALVKLKQYEAAESTLEFALENDPENEDALTELGNLYLHRGEWTQSLEVFQQALAIDPESPNARSGFMTALRARYPIYGLMLRYFLWMNGFSKRYQQGIQYGLSLAMRLMGFIRKEYPALAPVLGVILVVWRIFAYLSWTIKAGTTLLLRANKYGRQLVNEDEIFESNLVGGFWLAALLCWLYHTFVDPFTLFCRLGMPVFLTLPMVVGGSFATVDYGWPKYVSRAILAVMCFSAVGGLLIFTWGHPLGLSLLKLYFNSFPWVIIALALLEGVEPQRD